MVNALDLLDEYISNLESALGLAPGQSLPPPPSPSSSKQQQQQQKQQPPSSGTSQPKTKTTKPKKKPQAAKKAAAPSPTQPEICKLEFKVGVIKKVWVHPDADKLFCEEIDCGEDTPRQIASGLREYYSEEEMLGQRLLVVANLKPKNLVGFKSYGMVLCAASADNTKVEFIEPPSDAPLGERIVFQNLPVPEPLSASQVEKKKVFAKCMEGMRTTEDDGVASWNGHAFMTSKGPCKAKSIKGGAMR
mmetsp:Transcript_19851/g.24494  ORF Transcript_19851/g.24494 Transcript_19851/m.24494 type:complete len:247 (+) Transcript_19851:133-873(+)|eukprot:CAMPEP_0172492818 /NCGR_PEP_ID=MMETSP1066-20121228/24076_1 /TAXON_ID=671091 /ORGANISM="Coscinodiscus wailesii, Strain CCMP2513" /LENGTH=246 /DNA_ID=CAMNT_0013262637 /DNA_START=115 /DNA_END=855 /DNA_ORIENTATION=+